MYEIIKKLSGTTFIASDNQKLFILKKAGYEDIPLLKALSSVNNSHISACYGSAVIDNEIYSVSEYVSGETLGEYVERCGVLGDEETKRIVLDICDGLNAIHSKGIVHRDITPSNIIISSFGEVKIIDFGISRTIKAGASNDTQILGTHGYAAPEQFGFSQTTARADIYALGVLINYMKTGCLPGEKKASGFFRPIVEKCIEMDESNRYESARALQNAVSCAEEEKLTFRNFIYRIPGFRKNKKLVNVFSFIYYSFSLLMLLGITQHGVRAIFGDFLPIIFTFWLPYLLMWNIADWTGRIGFSKEKNKVTYYIIKLAASIVSITIAAILVNFFPTNNNI